jgi:putative GTP pyrophosphokinase
MIEGSGDNILDQYDRSLELYGDFTRKVEDLVKDMLHEAGVRAHTVTSRVKMRESLREKIARPDKNYSELGDVTDIAGVRIITYFADDVDKIAECIERWFEVDRKKSTDRRAALDPDRFGYLSLHHIVSFGPERAALPEYGQHAGLKAEIQTRSILQHAWAEIEHDLGYKTREGVPREIRRRFSALAGLLEIADREFEGIRDELAEYERKVPERIEREPQLVEIDKASLSAFISGASLVARLDNRIASSNGLTVAEWDEDDDFSRRLHDDFVEKRVAELQMFGIGTIQDLEEGLRRYEGDILEFAAKWLEPAIEEGKVGSIVRGVSVNYLTRVLAGRTRNVEQVQKFLITAGMIYLDWAQWEEEARLIIRIYDSISDGGP